MGLEVQKIAVADLEIGMYVCRLDRDWIGTPYPLQGVWIREQDDIDQLAHLCRDVFIDVERGRAPSRGPQRGVLDARRAERTRGTAAYTDTSTIDAELPLAREAQSRIAAFAGEMLDRVRSGLPISHERVREAVAPMVASILRNADAYLWLETLRERGGYDNGHALNCSALMAVFGRHMGFPPEVLSDMASAGLLLDVGKLRVDPALLARPGPLGAEEMAEARRHVAYGVAIVEADPGVPHEVREAVAGHHERHDGSGYPRGLAGDDIPLLARIAGLVDAYDAMTSDRAYRNGIARHEALQELYRLRGTWFPAELVEQFLQCMGVYPTGSLVELSSGEVAVVMGQNLARRLRPKIMLLTDADKALLPGFRAMDLMMQAENDDASVDIVGILAPGAHGLDPVQLFL